MTFRSLFPLNCYKLFEITWIKKSGEEDWTVFVIIIFRHLILIAQNSYSELSLSGLHHANSVGVRNGIGELTWASVTVLEDGNSTLLFKVLASEIVANGRIVLSFLCLRAEAETWQSIPKLDGSIRRRLTKTD